MGNDIIFAMHYVYYNHKFIIQDSRFRVQVDGFRVVVATSLQNIYLRRSRHHHF